MSAKDHDKEPKQPEEESVKDEETEENSLPDEEVSPDESEDYDPDDDFDDETETAAAEMRTTGMPEMAPPLLVVCFVVGIFASSIASYQLGYRQSSQDALIAQQTANENPITEETSVNDEIPVEVQQPEITLPPAKMLPAMQEYYDQNNDFIGWLKIDDMNVDYPVMQSMYDEEYYLNRDFDKNYSLNGCLIMDTDSVVGTGTAANDYADGTRPGTNLIIHGHNMKNGDMFGQLDRYRDEKFWETHKTIRFTSLYEEREYEVISVFLSQVYLKTQTDVFKYYKFFEAPTREDFDNFYNNIKGLALYDTGGTAKFGDEFITLSVCAYHVENGRLVVVGKRVK